MQAAWIVDPGESVLSIGILARQALRAAEKREREREGGSARTGEVRASSLSLIRSACTRVHNIRAIGVVARWIIYVVCEVARNSAPAHR